MRSQSGSGRCCLQHHAMLVQVGPALPRYLFSIIRVNHSSLIKQIHFICLCFILNGFGIDKSFSQFWTAFVQDRTPSRGRAELNSSKAIACSACDFIASVNLFNREEAILKVKEIVSLQLSSTYRTWLFSSNYSRRNDHLMCPVAIRDPSP